MKSKLKKVVLLACQKKEEPMHDFVSVTLWGSCNLLCDCAMDGAKQNKLKYFTSDELANMCAWGGFHNP
jgi:hypothetical protein